MKHYSEAELEIRVRQHDVGFDQHLGECPVCRERYHFLVRLRAAVVEESVRPRDERIGQLVGALSGKKPIVLHLRQHNPDLSPYGVEGGIMVLAAQSEHHAHGGLVPAVTFASEPDHVIIRVVHDDREKKFRLHLLTPRPEDAFDATVTIRPPEGDRIVVVTGADGTAVIDDSCAIAWGDVVIAVEPQAR